MSAKDELQSWAGSNVSATERQTLYRLVAAYVAESVRLDRERRANAEKARDAFEESRKRVDAINGKPDLTWMNDLFRR